eukprot:gene481-5311_t
MIIYTTVLYIKIVYVTIPYGYGYGQDGGSGGEERALVQEGALAPA